MIPIYLDAQATTPMLPEVLAAMTPYFTDYFGNPSSNHVYGWKAKAAVTNALTQVSRLVGCRPEQVFMTSGATESLHWAIIGWARKHPGGLILTSATDHKATFGACEWAQVLGAKKVVLPVLANGALDLRELEKNLGQGPTLISLIHANNEIGTINPIGKIVTLARQYPKTDVHFDGAQSVGKVPIQFTDWDIDYLSFSGHKLYGPKGVGALVVKDKTTLSPLFIGGGHQQEMRAGTLNVPGIVGLGAACEWCERHQGAESQRLQQLRNEMAAAFLKTGKAMVNGHDLDYLPNNLSVSFKDISMDKLLLALPQVGFSSSSACSSEQGEPSHVLQAIGRSPQEIRTTVRFGLSFQTTRAEIDTITAKILEIL